MIIIHAIAAQDNVLQIWGEAPVELAAGVALPIAGDDAPVPLAELESSSADSAEPRRGKAKPRARNLGSQVRFSPFDAGTERLEAGVGGLFSAQAAVSTVVELNFGVTRLSLPTLSKGLPCASSALIDESPVKTTISEMQPWSVTVFTPALDSLLNVLLNLSSANKVISHGVMAGDDLLYWAALSKFAAGLVIRQKYLPGLSERAGQWYSVWEPIISGADLDRLSALVAAAPGACFAVDDEFEGTSRLKVVHQIVAAMVDKLVRQSLSDTDANQKTVPDYMRFFGSPNPHDLWLTSLQKNDSRFDADDKQISQLRSELARWKRALSATVNAPFRLCFRLEDPPPLDYDDEEANDGNLIAALRLSEDLAVDERPWRITYLLQSAADPSLYIEAAAVWSESHKSSIVGRTAFSARESLLASLGAASMIYPAVEASLLNARPSSVELDVQEAYAFLTDKAGLLHQAGFGVMLPSWWTKPTARHSLRASARVRETSKMKTPSGGLSASALVDFKWQMALGNHKISRTELEELARLKVPLIKLRGQWIEISPEQLKAALKFLKGNKQSASVNELLQMSLGAIELPDGIGFGGVEGEGPVADLLDRFTGELKFEELPQPEHFGGTLRPYQQRGYSWMHFLSGCGLGGCLADDMGLGKTVQTLALISHYWHTTSAVNRRPVLLICPMSLVGNWQREASKFTPELPVMIHHGLTRKKGETFAEQAGQQALVIASNGLLTRDLEFLQQVDWAGVIIDEAQSIKNVGTQHSKSARSLTAGYKLALTGTPVENNVGDLWSIMEFLNPGLLGTQAQFKRNFLMPIQIDRDQDAMQKLKTIVSPFILRRLKTDKSIIKDLPDKVEMKAYCNLTREQASLYTAVLKDMEAAIESAEGIGRKGLVLATMSKLKQICNHPAQFLHDNSLIEGRSGKLQRITEMLEESLQVGDSSLVFTQFAEMGEMLRSHLQDTFGEQVLFLHGAVSQQRRDQMVERFQSDAGPKIFVLSIKAGGVGLNLTRANQVIHFDRWWNPAVENQATDRAFRIGQKKNVLVHKFVCLGTLEEKIDQMIEAKQELATNILGTGEGWLTELSNDQLRDIFALSKEAVSE